MPKLRERTVTYTERVGSDPHDATVVLTEAEYRSARMLGLIAFDPEGGETFEGRHFRLVKRA